MKAIAIIPATRFADPTVDFAFKRIFGTETYKQNTVNLLNDLIPDIGIVDVKFINGELQGETADSRKSIIDVCCEDASGKQGGWDYHIPPVYVVSFLNFPLDDLHLATRNGLYLLHYTLQDIETHEKMGGGTEFFFIIFSRFFNACERAGFSKDEEIEYVNDMMTRNDIENSKREACERSAYESKREVAKKMKADGLESSLIAKYSGLTAKEVEAL